jgi:CubicO group peptidase (beta-lactamase class C family)
MKKIIENIHQICIETGFNGCVYIKSNDKIIISSCFGYDDLNLKTKLEKNSIFRIGSITKQFTAVSILKLVEDGLCQLDDPIDVYINSVPYQETITIHHLLSNCSGIPNFPVFDDYSEFLNSSNFHKKMIHEVIFSKALHFKPGSQFEYSSSGYMILSYIIEVISKKSYAEFLVEHIFKPLNMVDSGFHFKDKMINKMPQLYDMDQGEIVQAKDVDMRIASGGGGLYSSIFDLSKWNDALISHHILSDKYQKMMFDIQTPINDTAGYGYGVICQNIDKGDKKHQVVYHPGNGPGVFAQNTIFDLNIQLIMLSNINDKDTFRNCYNQIYEIIVGKML